MSTTPTPQPGPAPQSQNQKDAASVAGAFSGLNLTPGSAAKGSNSYGLTGSDALLSVPGAGSIFYVPNTDPAGSANAFDVVKAFAGIGNPQLIAQLQDLLYKAGYYGDTSTHAPPMYGRLTSNDINAFADLTAESAKTNSDLSTLLNSRASLGQTRGIQNAVDQINRSKASTSVQEENPDKIGAVYDAEYKKLMGKAPDPSERAGFIVGYQNAYAAAQRSAIAAVAPKPPSILQDHLLSGPPTAADIAANAGDTPPPPLDAAGAQAAIQAGTPNPDPTVLPPEFDPASYTDNSIRNAHPDEVGAHDLTTQFGNFLSIISGIK